MKPYLPLTILVTFIFLIACNSGKQSSDELIVNDSRFNQFIKGHTQGTISSKDNITIQFSELVTLPDDVSMEDFMDIKPSIEGSVVKSDPHTVIFSPEKVFESGQDFLISLNLREFADIPDDLEEYRFKVDVIQQNFDLEVSQIQVPDPSQPNNLELDGLITTADFVENEAVEKMISISEDLPLIWNHTSGTSHRFSLSEIKREETERTITVTGSGAPIGVKESKDVRITIPSVEVFSVISTNVSLNGDAHVSIFFSDPLDTDQNLEGLIQLEGERDPRLVIRGNEVKLYVSGNISGSKKLEISEGIKNSKGKSLSKNVVNYVAFEPEKPQVRLLGNGTILPSTQGLVLPFEAVNLKAVQVEVVQIFEDNIPQFFQVNDLDGSSEVKRVGQHIMSRKISLTGKAQDLSKWNRFTLDLADLFNSEQGALYQVRIGFKPSYSNYPCEGIIAEEDENSEDRNWSIFDDDGFDSWGSMWEYRYPRGYTWSERENPCHVSYYISSRFVTTSLLATDIGLIAKIGSDNSLNIYTTNMINAKPIQASIRVLDYQLRELSSLNTDPQGKASTNPKRRPFLIIAEANGQKSYLKLADNEALSTSNFDVSGTRIEGNIKGFIYGERGVWRPGDNIYLSFMLEDPADKIPGNHPIVMELHDPRGNVKDKQVVNAGIKGLYTFQTKTNPDDITGNWWATVSVGNSKFRKTVKIEAIKPNRLKINLDFGDGLITPSESVLSGKLNVNWLTGLTGSNLKAETELKLLSTNTTFDGYAQYEFDDVTKSYFKDPKKVFSGQVNEQGEATMNVQLPKNPNSSGAIRAIFNTKVFEPGGNFSINSKSLTYLPYESFVGVNLSSAENGNRIKRDQPQELSIITLDANGKPISRSGLEFKLYKLEWRWWWDQSEDYSTNYLSSNYASLISSKKVNTTGGKGKISFAIKRPMWGRFLAIVSDPESGHSASKEFFTSWYGDSEGTKIGATSLEISTDKDKYAVGDKMTVTMKGSREGQALVSIENGSSVLETFWIKTEREWTSFTVDIKKEMSPNIYLHVSLLQPHGQTSNDLPIRLYGISSVRVFDPGTQINPEIDMAEELAPGKPVEITVSESSGKSMAYTLAVVDEGLLDITNFKTPQPWNHFYSKEAIGVKTWDIYSDVIGAYGGRLERLLAIGGGEGALSDGQKPKENRFKPVVQFMGPFYLDAGKSKKHTFTMPQYIGSVKTMVVAGLDGAYGNTEKVTPVIKPLMVLGTLPRVVGPGEKVSLPVNVFRYKDNIRSAKVSIETSGVLNITGSKNQNISLDKESGTLYFDLEVDERLGAGKIVINASSGTETATHEINIESRSPNAPQTQVKLYPVEPGKSVAPGVNLFGMEGTNEVTLEIASIPPINLEQRLKYLIRYPHGCIEQTVSSAFPQLYLEDVMELSGDQKILTESNIKKAIERIGHFQYSGGGLSYWPGGTRANSWGTNYAYHFLVEAQKKGFAVPTNLINNIRRFQQNKARRWTKSVDYSGSELIQAYRLFTLALDGHAELGAMNRLRNTSGKSLESTYKLAATYALIGQTDAANQLMKNGNSKLEPRTYSYYYYSYGSYERDLAILLEAYVYLNNKPEAYRVLQELSKRLSSDKWLSTQSTAYSLLAISKYVTENQSNGGLKAEVIYDGNKTTWSSDKAIYRSAIPPEKAGSLSLENQGEATLFATLTITGTPKPGKEPVESNDLNVSIRYLNETGRPVSVDSVKLGQNIDIVVTIQNAYTPGQVRDIALTHIIPSGWEIRNDRLTDQESNEYSPFDYQDIRDDRIYTYFDLKKGQKKAFKVSVTAAYPGKYYMPGIQAEAMYKADISAKTGGKWVYVVE